MRQFCVLLICRHEKAGDERNCYKSNSYNSQLSSENKKAISPFSSPGYSSQQIKSQQKNSIIVMAGAAGMNKKTKLLMQLKRLLFSFLKMKLL